MTRRTLTLGLVATGIQAVRYVALQVISAAETASYGTCAVAMSSAEMPTWDVIPRGGQLLWRVCGCGLCVEACCGERALAEFEALCRSHGIEPPSYGHSLPQRGPSEVDEPGV